MNQPLRTVRVAVVLDVKVFDADWSDVDLKQELPDVVSSRLREPLRNSEESAGWRPPYDLDPADVTVYVPEDQYDADLEEIKQLPLEARRALAACNEAPASERARLWLLSEPF